jgi:hypothetical protein
VGRWAAGALSSVCFNSQPLPAVHEHGVGHDEGFRGNENVWQAPNCGAARGAAGSKLHSRGCMKTAHSAAVLSWKQGDAARTGMALLRCIIPTLWVPQEHHQAHGIGKAVSSKCLRVY